MALRRLAAPLMARILPMFDVLAFPCFVGTKNVTIRRTELGMTARSCMQ
jgi:hypothetical protein